VFHLLVTTRVVLMLSEEKILSKNEGEYFD